MTKLFVLLLVSVVMLSGCGESEQEKANYEAIESEGKDFWGPGGPGTLDDWTEAERERQRKLTDEQKAADEAAAKKATEETPAEHPAITVANQVLGAIQAGDAAAIRPLLNATDQEKVNDDEIAQYLKGEQESIGDVTKVTEVRGGLGYGLSWTLTPVSTFLNQVMAKIRVAGDEVFVVVLTLEEGQYRFFDIKRPTVDNYEAQPIVAP